MESRTGCNRDASAATMPIGQEGANPSSPTSAVPEIKESLEEAKENLRLALMSKISLNKQLASAVELVRDICELIGLAKNTGSIIYLDKGLDKAEQWLKNRGA